MEKMNHIKTEDSFLMIQLENGPLKHIPVKIHYSWENDDRIPDFDYGNEEENSKEMNRFKSGEMVNILLKCTAEALGEKGTDYLGQCFVKAESLEIDLLSLAIDHDMKNNACLELRAFILSQYRTMKNALEA